MSDLDDTKSRQEYEWFLREILDRKELIMRIRKKDPIGSTDEEFQDYKNL